MHTCVPQPQKQPKNTTKVSPKRDQNSTLRARPNNDSAASPPRNQRPTIFIQQTSWNDPANAEPLLISPSDSRRRANGGLGRRLLDPPADIPVLVSRPQPPAPLAEVPVEGDDPFALAITRVPTASLSPCLPPVPSAAPAPAATGVAAKRPSRWVQKTLSCALSSATRARLPSNCWIREATSLGGSAPSHGPLLSVWRRREKTPSEPTKRRGFCFVSATCVHECILQMNSSCKLIGRQAKTPCNLGASKCPPYRGIGPRCNQHLIKAVLLCSSVCPWSLIGVGGRRQEKKRILYRTKNKASVGLRGRQPEQDNRRGRV